MALRSPHPSQMGRPVRPRVSWSENRTSPTRCALWYGTTPRLPGKRTRTAWSPPLQHQVPERVSTGVEAALASLLSFTSEQPDGGRSHCGAPGSHTTALVCPRAPGAAEFARNSFALPEGVALSPETHGLSEDLAVCDEPEGCVVHATEIGGMCCSEETGTGDTSIACEENKFLRDGTSSIAQTRSSRSLR